MARPAFRPRASLSPHAPRTFRATLTSCATLTPRAWRLLTSGLAIAVLGFLIAPILVIIPLSFSADPFLSYPISEWSLR